MSEGAAFGGEEVLSNWCRQDLAGMGGCVCLCSVLKTGLTGKVVGETGKAADNGYSPVQEHCCHPDF